ncbi:hypothetical protein ISS42_03340 [Candidatus Shapirobacteria bacterium]|nr:hypothetical protein [Candidatus Shapirobacteria bacterium]
MFKNRNQAGKQLADKIKQEANLDYRKSLVVSLPKGGVVIGAVLSALLDLPHQALAIKKITLNIDTQLAIGAVGESSQSLILNQDLINQLKADEEEVKKAIKETQNQIREIKKQLEISESINWKNKTIIIADDGAATGATILSAIKEVGERGVSKIIIALPVAPKETVDLLQEKADKVIVLEQPELFFAVSEFYEDFPQLTWDEVKNLLKLNQD